MEIILLMASTVDGKIARNSSQFVDWTGKADKKYFTEITRKAGVVIMGSKTYDTIGKPLIDRLNVVMTRNTANRFLRKNLLFTKESPQQLINTLENEGYTQAILIGGAETNSSFLQENLITQIHLTVVPKLFGTGLSLFSKETDKNLKLLQTKKLCSDKFVLVYQVIN